MIMEPIVTLAELIQVIYGYFEWLVNEHWFKTERPVLPKLYRLNAGMGDQECPSLGPRECLETVAYRALVG
jgi:hypothetical protein